MVSQKYQIWIEEVKDVKEPRLFWDLIKYRIKQKTMSYSKSKARERRASLREMEETLCDQDPPVENINKLEILETEYDFKFEYIAQ